MPQPSGFVNSLPNNTENSSHRGRTRVKHTQYHSFMKGPFGIDGVVLHALLCLFLLNSALATSSANLSFNDSLPFETIEQFVSHGRMNAIAFYRQLMDWFVNNVTDWNMFLIQSLATCGSLIWCVASLDLRRRTSTDVEA